MNIRQVYTHALCSGFSVFRKINEEPHQLSVGIRDVLVNGVAVVRDGSHTGEKPGMIVRGPGYID